MADETNNTDSTATQVPPGPPPVVGNEIPGFDGNGDGINDDEQDHVFSIRDPFGRPVTFVTILGIILEVELVSNPSPIDAPNCSFPFGFFEIVVTLPIEMVVRDGQEQFCGAVRVLRFVAHALSPVMHVRKHGI